MVQDPVSDMLTRIRNAIMSRYEKVDIPFSRLKKEVIKVMKNEGLIRNFKLMEDENNHPMIRVFLKYAENGEPVMSHLERVSKPSKRVYVDSTSIPRRLNGLSITVLSTSKGVISGAKARDYKVGGEVLCHLW